jgi:general secretion pathway protein G
MNFSTTPFASLRRGFSIIELMVVLAIVAILLTLVSPRYQGSIAASKEVVLRENLATVRKALDQHYADKGAFPSRLEDLVALQYLRSLPVDPITNENNTWLLIGPNAQPIDSTNAGDRGGKSVTIRDIRSGATGESKSGGAYSTW